VVIVRFRVGQFYFQAVQVAQVVALEIVQMPTTRKPRQQYKVLEMKAVFLQLKALMVQQVIQVVVMRLARVVAVHQQLECKVLLVQEAVLEALELLILFQVQQ
jgi:nucleoside diphosphate kinase